MLDFIKGAVAMGFLVAAGHFFRFWRESGDRLFGWFAAAFLLLSVNNVLLAAIHENVENSLAPYAVRLFAFVIIAVAIIDKNFRRT